MPGSSGAAHAVLVLRAIVMNAFKTIAAIVLTMVTQSRAGASRRRSLPRQRLFLASQVTRLAAALVSAILFSGCVSAQVQRGAAWGAVTGAAAGGAIGWVASDEHLLGPSNSRDNGRIGLPVGQSIGAGVLIGAVVGGVVGAMVGHRRDEGYEQPPPQPEEPSASTAADQNAQARPKYLRF